LLAREAEQLRLLRRSEAQLVPDYARDYI
jgi:hypothetical protein